MFGNKISLLFFLFLGIYHMEAQVHIVFNITLCSPISYYVYMLNISIKVAITSSVRLHIYYP